jgi:hypothetical protein
VADLRAFRVAVPLPCKGCGYDVRGLGADGRCPECGVDVVDSIAERVDPELALLPPLAHPRRAAVCVFVAAAALLVAVATTSASATAMALASMPGSGWRNALSQWLPPALPGRIFAVAPVAIAFACAASIGLVRWSGAGGARRLLLPCGLVGWLIVACLEPTPFVLAMTGVMAMIALTGLGPVLSSLGGRSRTYRQREGAQQATGPLTAAIGVGVLAALSADLLTGVVAAEWLAQLRVVAMVCLVMTVVGFAYLAVNAAWIAAALLRFHPLLERVVDLDRTDEAAS